MKENIPKYCFMNFMMQNKIKKKALSHSLLILSLILLYRDKTEMSDIYAKKKIVSKHKLIKCNGCRAFLFLFHS